jgi:hypothetical protein
MTDSIAPSRIQIFGIDVGSVRRKGGFSWSTADASQRGQDDPSQLGDAVVSALESGRQVALAFECPLSVPVPGVQDGAWQELGRARTGEGNRSWSAGAGTGALATGLVQLSWVLAYVRDRAHESPRVTTSLDRFTAGEAKLLIAEAMVTSDGKPEPVDGLQDHADALAAAKRLYEILSAGPSGFEADVACAPQTALNLAATAAMHAGMPIDPVELREDVLVTKVRPVPAGPEGGAATPFAR